MSNILNTTNSNYRRFLIEEVFDIKFLTTGDQTGTDIKTTRLYDIDGNLEWSVTRNQSGRSISGNGQGQYVNVGQVSAFSATFSHQLYDVNGNLINQWGDYTITGLVNSVDYKDNYVYSGQNNFKVVKWTDDGTMIWEYDIGPSTGSGQLGVAGVVVDNDDYVYACSGNGKIVKLSSTGSLVWEQNWTAPVNAIDIDNSGNVYTVGNSTASVTTRKWSATGSVIWTNNYGANAFGLAVNRTNGDVHVGGISTVGSVIKYNTSGTLQWTASHGNTIRAIAVDSVGDVYMGGERISSITTRKFRGTNGSLLWSKDHGNAVRGVCVD